MQEYDETELELKGPDWWSRLMALGSLLVAGTALWFARYGNDGMEHQATPTPEIAALIHQLKAEARASEIRQTKFDSLVSEMERITTYRPSTAGVPTELIPPPNQNDDDVPSLGGMGNESLLDDASENSPTGDKNSEETTTADLASDLFDEESESAASDVASEDSILRTVETPQLPVNSDFATATVSNESLEPAYITHVKFQPASVVEDIPTSLAIEAPSQSTDSELVVEYAADENTATNPSDHGTYFRKLVEPFLASAGDQFEIKVAIKNPTHIGYGLRGTLTLEYNTTESMSIDNAVLIFVGRPQAE